jgi:hypothetical protein
MDAVNPDDVSPSLMLAFMREQSSDILSSADVARRIGISRQGITSIHTKNPDFTNSTVIGYIGGLYLHWWPAVREWLDKKGRAYGEPAIKGSRHVCVICGCVIMAGELENKMSHVTGRYRHFIGGDCTGALQRSQREEFTSARR